ncbi:MAG: DUF2029 domain-containing protein [Cytophagales bacterium]|nr:DUF2029 domain-containing protein [Cytophagales bacterium]
MKYLIKFINNAADKLILFISKKSRVDGRVVLLLVITLYFIAIYVSSFFMDYTNFWQYFGVPAAKTLFLDLNINISIFECYRKGYDVLSTNPCHPYHENYSYPRMWLLFSYLPFSYDNIIAIAIGIVTIFYVFTFWLIGKLNVNEGIYYGLIMCSPPIMLAVERCNPDLFIFILCALSVLIVKKKYTVFWSCTFLMLASFLKLYPFATIAAFFNERRKPSLILFFVLLSIGIIYIFFNLQDIIYISHLLKEKYWSISVATQYGCLVFLNLLDYYPIFHNIFSLIPIKIIAYATIAVLILTLLFIVKKQKSALLNKVNLFEESGHSGSTRSLQKDHFFSFKIGACIYIGTFLIGNNFDYKFIFLIFAIPQLLAWVKYNNVTQHSCSDNNVIRTPTMLALIGIIITFWSYVLFGKFYFFLYTLIEEFINWYIFAYLIFMMIHTLPLWAKRMLVL